MATWCSTSILAHLTTWSVTNHYFVILSPIETPRKIKFGDGNILTSTVKGTLKLGDMVLYNVLYIPGLSNNLISVSGTNGGTWQICKNSATLFDSTGKQVITAQMQGGLYPIKVSQLAQSLSAIADTPSTPLTDWHLRLGHLNVRSLMRLARLEKISGLSQVSDKEIHGFECKDCLLGKGTRLPAPPNDTRATVPLAVVHTDIWGPSPVPSIGGCKYFLTCYDDYTHKVHITFLKHKSDAFHSNDKLHCQSGASNQSPSQRHPL